MVITQNRFDEITCSWHVGQDKKKWIVGKRGSFDLELIPIHSSIWCKLHKKQWQSTVQNAHQAALRFLNENEEKFFPGNGVHKKFLTCLKATYGQPYIWKHVKKDTGNILVRISEIQKILLELEGKGKDPDLLFTIGEDEVTIGAFKSVIDRHVPMLRTHYKESSISKTIVIPDIDVQCFRDLMEYIGNEEMIPHQPTRLLNLCSFARELKYNELVKSCEHKIFSERADKEWEQILSGATDYTAEEFNLSLRHLSELHGLSQNDWWLFSRRKFYSVLDSMSEAPLLKAFDSDYLGLSESHVFEAYKELKGKGRDKLMLEKLFNCIRVEHMGLELFMREIYFGSPFFTEAKRRQLLLSCLSTKFTANVLVAEKQKTRPKRDSTDIEQFAELIF